jgi:hypothetical protein
MCFGLEYCPLSVPRLIPRRSARGPPREQRQRRSALKNEAKEQHAENREGIDVLPKFYSRRSVYFFPLFLDDPGS